MSKIPDYEKKEANIARFRHICY